MKTCVVIIFSWKSRKGELLTSCGKSWLMEEGWIATFPVPTVHTARPSTSAPTATCGYSPAHSTPSRMTYTGQRASQTQAARQELKDAHLRQHGVGVPGAGQVVRQLDSGGRPPCRESASALLRAHCRRKQALTRQVAQESRLCKQLGELASHVCRKHRDRKQLSAQMREHTKSRPAHHEERQA